MHPYAILGERGKPRRKRLRVAEGPELAENGDEDVVGDVFCQRRRKTREGDGMDDGSVAIVELGEGPSIAPLGEKNRGDPIARRRAQTGLG